MTTSIFATKKQRTFKHSGDLGDLIYSLPAVRALGGGMLLLSANHDEDMLALQRRGYKSNRFPTGINKYDESSSGLTNDSIVSVTNLLLQQPYITAVQTWDGEDVDYDLDLWRTRRTDYFRESICYSHARVFNVHRQIGRSAWLTTPSLGVVKAVSVVFARSQRYHNPEFPWRDIYSAHGREAVFVGYAEEHYAFEKEFGSITYLPTKDILDLAKIIRSARLFVGNQSLPYALAEGLKVTTIQETSPHILNCIFPRENAQYFIDGKLCTLSEEPRKRWWRCL